MTINNVPAEKIVPRAQDGPGRISCSMPNTLPHSSVPTKKWNKRPTGGARMPIACVSSATGSCSTDIAKVAMKPATTPLPIRSVIEMSVRMALCQRCRGCLITPLGVEKSVLAHQADFSRVAAFAKLARGIDREQHRFGFALVRAELFVCEFDHPVVVMLDEKIQCWRHLVLIMSCHPHARIRNARTATLKVVFDA